ncbi:DUF1761 domain-containing protein [Aurantibacillus circumpalustris]|uniref:DUF1761 domain-containing protein n=1 Tax=Aurantibacillus circumpalustris TaxID=3036359 RepID=UPI00295AF6B8|nr:DUF1761 domain-containing protein [Aurantibacillus circumpalustris]
MEPNIHINYIAILIAVVANFVLGFLWYTPLFGKTWGKEMGFNMEEKPDPSIMIKGMVFMVIGNFLMAYVFAHNMAVWNPVTWGLEPSTASPSAVATMAAIFTWLGFYFPNDLGSTVWEKKSWKLFWINTGYHFFCLFVAAMILANMA